jgi:hypothetical protein
MSASYSYEQLKQMRGQAVKDVWHAMIGKPAGIKNTTGLKSGDEIIRAILEAQENPELLKKFTGRPPKQVEQEKEQEQPKEMPPKAEKKKPGPKPKVKASPLPPPLQRTGQTLAYESAEIPIVPVEIHRIVVKKLFVDDTLYFLEPKTNKLYSVLDGRPGSVCGLWDPQGRQVQDVDS